ncbi:PAS domain S-box protein [Noviherbaspirillum soli]|uniref:PAS domain S-box protein n=1 Tax=Noviherbaspirillum soli TaxID=1064518 RepID=UPI001E3EE322|nr:PAS domain S-box protein [Noviherbaspirillum soli]
MNAIQIQFQGNMKNAKASMCSYRAIRGRYDRNIIVRIQAVFDLVYVGIGAGCKVNAQRAFFLFNFNLSHLASSDQPDQPGFDHPPTFRAAVALAADKGDQGAEALAERFGITPQQVLARHDELLENAGPAFRNAGDAASAARSGHAELALAIAENSTQGFAMMDQSGYRRYANRAWLEMTGYTVDEIRSRPLHSWFIITTRMAGPIRWQPARSTVHYRNTSMSAPMKSCSSAGMATPSMC